MASTGSNALSNYDGWFKEVYSKNGIDQAIPNDVLLTQMVPFSGGAERIGNKFHRPVRVKDEHGVTFTDGTDDSLNAAVAGQTEDAYIQSNEIIGRARLRYVVMARATDAGSFGDVTAEVVDSLKRSTHKKLEVQLLYGGAGIGEVDSVSGSVVTLTSASWAPFIWIGSEGMPVDVYNGASLVISTTISSVDPTNKTVTLADATGVAATHDFYYKGAYGKEMIGLSTIAGNTGTLFGIDASNYSVWNGNTVAVGGALSYTNIQDSIYQAQSKGAAGEMECLVSLKTFSKLIGDMAALRSIDESYSRDVQYGHEKLTFITGNGKVNVRASGFIKEGEAYLFKKGDLSRIGSRDMSFEIPGRPGKFVLDLQDHAAIEFRCYSDQSLFTTKPAHMVKMTGITNA